MMMMMVMVIMIKELADADAVAVSPRSVTPPVAPVIPNSEDVFLRPSRDDLRDARSRKCGRRARMLRYTIAMKCLKKRETTPA